MIRKSYKTATIAVIVAGVAVCGILVAMRFNKVSVLNKTIAENNTTIETLQGQFDTTSEQTTETVETIQQKLSSAAMAGSKIAELQNSYFNINPDIDEGLVAMQNVATEMDTYLDDTSNRVPWYGASDTDASWKFESTYGFSGDEVPVVWTCNSVDGELFAYATATYSVESNKFKDLEHHITSIGSSHLKNEELTEEDGAQPNEELAPSSEGYEDSVDDSVSNANDISSDAGQSYAVEQNIETDDGLSSDTATDMNAIASDGYEDFNDGDAD